MVNRWGLGSHGKIVDMGFEFVEFDGAFTWNLVA